MLSDAELAILRDEIATDPKGIGYAAWLPDAPGMVVQLLGEQSDSMVKAIHSTTAQAWAATGPMATIVDTAADKAHPCRASCLLVQLTLSAGSDIHMERPDVDDMFKAWLSQGVITQAWYDDLRARALQPASRLEVLGLPQISEIDIRAAS